MTSQHITTVITDFLVQYLDDALAQPFHDLNLGEYSVKVGRLQADPERPGINIMVHTGKPKDDKWFDSPVGGRYIKSQGGLMGYEDGDTFAIGEVGGGRTWLRRFSVECRMFFTRTKESRDEAYETANLIRGLLENALSQWIVLGQEDSFGERASRLLLSRSLAEERGGPNAHIWDVWLYLTVETSRP